METLIRLLEENGFAVAGTVPAHSSWWIDPVAVAIMESAHMIVVNGEGTIHHDRPAGAALLEAGAWAKARGIPAVLINAGWEANGPAFAGRLADFARVVVRDSRSAAALRAEGVASSVVPDLSLVEDAPPRRDALRRGIGVTDSVDRQTTYRLDALRRRLGAANLPISFPAAGARGRATFVRGAIAREDLRHPLRAFGQLRARAAQLAALAPDADAYVRRLAGLELLVSGRFHACTLALVARTPFVAVASNTDKIAALVADAGLDPARAACALDPSAIESARRAGWATAEAASAGAYLAHARDAAANLFADLGRLT